jgi:hypothetical protein
MIFNPFSGRKRNTERVPSCHYASIHKAGRRNTERIRASKYIRQEGGIQREFLLVQQAGRGNTERIPTSTAGRKEKYKENPY